MATSPQPCSAWCEVSALRDVGLTVILLHVVSLVRFPVHPLASQSLSWASGVTCDRVPWDNVSLVTVQLQYYACHFPSRW